MDANRLSGEGTMRLTDEQIKATLAAVFASLGCGRADEARTWARKLITWLETV